MGTTDQTSRVTQRSIAKAARPIVRNDFIQAACPPILSAALLLRHLVLSSLGRYDSTMSDTDAHAGHPALIARLKRADGHLRSVIAMLEVGKPCLEVAQQLLAVEKAVANAKRVLIHDHMDHCLDVEGSETDRGELTAIARYL